MRGCEHKPAGAGEKAEQRDAGEQGRKKEERKSKNQCRQKDGEYRITNRSRFPPSHKSGDQRTNQR